MKSEHAERRSGAFPNAIGGTAPRIVCALPQYELQPAEQQQDQQDHDDQAEAPPP